MVDLDFLRTVLLDLLQQPPVVDIIGLTLLGCDNSRSPFLHVIFNNKEVFVCRFLADLARFIFI